MTTSRHRPEVLLRLLRSGARSRLRRLVGRMDPPDVAAVLPELGPEEIRAVVGALVSAEEAGHALREIPAESLPAIVAAVDDVTLGSIVERLPPDDAAFLLRALPEERRSVVRTALPAAIRQEVDRLLAYPLSTAGSVMTTRLLALRESQSTEEATLAIRRQTEADSDQVFYLYVTDDEGRLRGTVPIRRLVTSAPDRRLGEIMLPGIISVRALADQEEAAALVRKHNLLAIPVVDAGERLVGVITVDDVLEVIDEEATEDMFRMVGLGNEERITTPIATSIRRRLPWMVVNLATAFLAASVVGLFEDSIRDVVALAVFLPIVAGMGGNGGTQTLTIVTRSLALGDLPPAAGRRAVVRQLAVGVTIGAVVGLLTAVAAWIWRGDPMIGLVLFLSMVITMAVAGFAGAAVPLLLRSLSQDPALGSGVLVTTFTDVCGFLSFLGIATLLLQWLR